MAEAYRVVITEVTRYGSSLFCVAGWDIDRGIMIRPEPATINLAREASRFWPKASAGPGQVFAVGNIVSFEAHQPPKGSALPHATEDRICTAQTNFNVIRQIKADEVAGIVRKMGGVSASLSDAFDGGLVRAPSTKGYVLLGHNGRSLGALETKPNQISFHEAVTDKGKRQFRVKLQDGGADYDLSLTSDKIRSVWESKGMNAARESLASGTTLHVRVGLCRASSITPDKCYAQVNDIHEL